MVGRDWLPEDVYLVASDDGTTRELIDPGLGLDPTEPGVTIDAAGATRGAIVELPLRALQGSQYATSDRGRLDRVDGCRGVHRGRRG